ncbi:MAG: DegT/DnrJ/EryC1/StrS family aminotransferase, partial [Dehalococcoidia bacterium]
RKARPPLPFPTGAPRVRWYAFARAAIWDSVAILGLQPGDEVLVPGFQSGAEIDPLLQAGLSMRYSSAESAWALSVAELEALVTSKTRAVLLIHFLGFAQPETPAIRDFCAQRGLFLIEDCAPSLYSRLPDGRELGTFGDVAVFSPSKTIPIGSGAALVLNNPALDFARAAAQVRAPLRQRLRRTRAWVPPPDDGGVRRFPRGHLFRRERHEGVAIPAIARWMLARARPADVIKRRRENYTAILDALEPCPTTRPLLEGLPIGAVPLAFPIVTSEAERVVATYRRFGIGALIFWRLAHDHVPDEVVLAAAHLRGKVVVVPVHQGLRADQLRRATRALFGPVSETPG